MNKRGVTVQATIISIIILIITAGILFYFFKYLPYKEITDKEACRQSVLLRSQAIAGLKPGQFLVPLNCHTQEIKISSTNEEFIKQEIANAMYDCWWMLGEGKMNFFSESTWKKATNLAATSSACVICAIIKFDEKVKDKVKEIDLTSYLSETPIPKKNITYLEYFTEQPEAEKIPTDVRMATIDTSKEYVILYEAIRSEGFAEPLVKDAALATGGFLLFGSKSSLFAHYGAAGQLLREASLGVKVKEAAPLLRMATADTIKGVMRGIVGFFKGPLGWIFLAYVAAQEAFVFQSKFAVVGQCGQWGDGCSLLILEEATPEILAKKCGRIESIP